MNSRSYSTGSAFLIALILLVIPQCSGKSPHDTSIYDWLFAWMPSSSPSIQLDNLKGKENVFPMVVIGSGPAGMSAGLYGARAKKKTIVIEGSKPGGLLTETSYVENWPGSKPILGKDLMKELREQAAHFGAIFLDETVDKVDFSQWPYVVYTEDGKKLYAMTIIIATGASPSPLNIPGEKEYWGKGVTTCAICDAPFYQDKDVVVIGGGDSAIAEAIQLAAYAKKITILVRKDKMRAAAANQDLLKGYPKISVMYNVSPQEIIGNKEHVVAIRLLDNKTKEEKTLDIEGVFLAVGHKPNTQLFKHSTILDSNGYVVVKGRSQETSLPGVYAAGDCEDHHYRQAGVAAGSGIKAALDADAFLNELGFNEEIASRLQETQVASVTITPSLVKHVMSVEEFETELAGSKVPVLVDFYADYCPTCMAMLPHFDAVAQQFKDCAYFLSVDVAAVPGLKEKYHVTKIPCLLLFKDGVQTARYNNAMSKKELQELTAQFVGQTSAVCKEEKSAE